jgi:hypothetical protein
MNDVINHKSWLRVIHTIVSSGHWHYLCPLREICEKIVPDMNMKMVHDLCPVIGIAGKLCGRQVLAVYAL